MTIHMMRMSQITMSDALLCLPSWHGGCLTYLNKKIQNVKGTHRALRTEYCRVNSLRDTKGVSSTGPSDLMRMMTESTEYVIAITTCPEAEAEKIARALVESRTCACVNILSGVKSIYFWENETHSDYECILMMKTLKRLTGQVYQIIRRLHSYQVPEFVVLPIIDGAQDYLAWIEATCQRE